MTIEERLDSLEQRWGANDEAVKAMRDSLTVQAHLEAKSSRDIKHHAERLETLDEEIARLRLDSEREHTERVREMDALWAEYKKEERERGEARDKRIGELVSSGDLIRSVKPQ